MKRILSLLFALALGGLCARSAPVPFSDLPATNNPSVLSLVAISALTGASTYTSRSQTISNLVQTTIGIVPQFITSSNNLVAIASNFVYAASPGLTSGTWHLTNAGNALIVKSNSTVYGTFRGLGFGINTNSPQAALHVYSGSEPQLLIESPGVDIDGIVLKHGGVRIFDVTSTGGNGGVLNVFDTNGVPTVSFAHGADSYIDRNMEGHGLAIGTNNAQGYDLFVSGNARFTDGIYSSGTFTNAGNIRVEGIITYIGQTTNLVMTLGPLGNMTTHNLAVTNLIPRDSILSQGVPIGATNSIDFSTNTHQYYVVTNDTALAFVAGTPNIGGGTLTLFNGGSATYNLYYPAFTRLDTGALPPSTIASNGFFTLVFRWMKSESHVAVLGDTSSVTVQTNGVDVGSASRINFVGATAVATSGTNTVTVTGGAGGGLLMNANQFTTNTTTAWIENGAVLTNISVHPTVVGVGTALTLEGNLYSTYDYLFGDAGTVGQIDGAKLFFEYGTVGTESIIVSNANNTALGILKATRVQLDNLLVTSNVLYRAYQAVVVANATNFVVDFNRSEVELPSSLITNGIFVVHCTNGPPSGSGTNVFTAWNIETGNTNRHFYVPPECQGNIYGTNTSTASFMLPSNVVVRIVFERRRGLISGDFMSYPSWTP